jgi:hypothetical protein
MKYGTPCRDERVYDDALHKMIRNGRSPNVSYCPLEDNETPIALPLRTRNGHNNNTNSSSSNNNNNNNNNEKINIWKHQLTRYQKFLWTADEMEYRYHKLRTNYPKSRYYEITWSNSSELQDGVENVKQAFYREWKQYFDTAKLIVNNNNNTNNNTNNDTDSSNGGGDDSGGNDKDDDKDSDKIIFHSILDKKIVHMKKHTTKLETQLRNCTDEITQDLQYREFMQYDQHVSSILFQRYPQVIRSDKCAEGKDDLLRTIQRYYEDKTSEGNHQIPSSSSSWDREWVIL